MKKGSQSVNWSDEVAVAVRVVGKSILKFLGWMLSALMTLGLVGVITGTIVGGAFLLYVKNHLDTSVDDFGILAEDRNMTTVMSYVDKDGNVVELEDERLSASENRVWTKYSEMNDYIPKAFVAIEDKRFWSHDGVDWIRTASVTVNFLLGTGTAGGSTITQQLIKNITGEDDTTIQRKAQEIFRALNLEKRYDKTQILEMYLNNIYLSEGCYGVGAAAYTYFSKEVKDLTLIESAAIAAITQNPSRWDPLIYPENNAIRRNEIIQRMYNQGLITQEEYASAYGQELTVNPPGSDDDSGSYRIHSWYTDAAQQEATSLLMKKFNCSASFAEKLLLTGGYNVVTAQDPEVQAVIEKYYEDTEADYWQRKDESPIQPESSCVVIDPQNGNVVGLVGGRGQKYINLGLNYATQTKRPVGSSIKPISVYGPALEAGLITYGSILDDVPLDFGTKYVDPETGEVRYSIPNGYPKNSPNTYRGLTTVHEAVRVSINTISCRVLNLLGHRNSFDFLTEKLGISTLVESMTTSGGYIYTDIAMAPLAMGEFTWGCTVKEVTSAYQIFANGGIYNEERIVLRILDSNGDVVVDNQQKIEIVMSAQNASIMTQMMEEVVSSGTASAVTLKWSIDCAGKTGTTQSNRDRWFVGYTPYYVCGVWFGYSMPRSLDKYSATQTVPILLWDRIMTEINAKYIEDARNGGEPLKNFDPAPGIITATYCMDSGKLMTDACKQDIRGNRAEIGYFVSGTEPTEYCDVHTMVDYCTEGEGFALAGCDPDHIVQKSYIKVFRSFPSDIRVLDAFYTCWDLPTDYSFDGLMFYQPYYHNLLPEGFFSGKSGETYRWNRICILHPSVIESTTESTTLPVDTSTPITSITTALSSLVTTTTRQTLVSP